MDYAAALHMQVSLRLTTRGLGPPVKRCRVPEVNQGLCELKLEVGASLGKVSLPCPRGLGCLNHACWATVPCMRDGPLHHGRVGWFDCSSDMAAPSAYPSAFDGST